MSPLFLSRVAVGSVNPVKVGAVGAVVRQAGLGPSVDGVQAASGVPDQPWGDEETIAGAVARARAARLALDADLGVGIEGGVVEAGGGMLRTCAWAAVLTRDGREYVGGSLSMPLPPAVSDLVRGGMELGHAMDAVTGGRDTKRGAGAVGVLTNGLIDRQRAYEVIVTYALAPLLAPACWPPGDAPPVVPAASRPADPVVSR